MSNQLNSDSWNDMRKVFTQRFLEKDRDEWAKIVTIFIYKSFMR